jgi:predicted nucleic acid-binding protein
MQIGINYIYCDSCVFIAYFNAEAGRVEILDELFAQIKPDNQRKLLTSVLTIAEEARVATEKLGSNMNQATEARFDAFWSDNSLIEFLDVNEATSRNARTLMRMASRNGHVLKTPDSLHLASAVMAQVPEFYTYDDFRRFQVLVPFVILEPKI